MTARSVATAQVWSAPELRDVNVPRGGVERPCPSRPQQEAEPSGRRPHAWLQPELTEANVPGGGTVSPSVSSPQHAREPTAVTPQ